MTTVRAIMIGRADRQICTESSKKTVKDVWTTRRVEVSAPLKRVSSPRTSLIPRGSNAFGMFMVVCPSRQAGLEDTDE